MILTNAILIIIACIALKYFTKLADLHILVAAIVGFTLLSLINRGTFAEGFGNQSLRPIRYGDIITLWSWKNKFITASATDVVHLSERLTQPSEIPRRWVYEYFVIEDVNDPKGPGNRGTVKFGDKVYLRSWRYHYLSADDNKGIKQVTDRENRQQFEVGSIEIDAKTGSQVNFGDSIQLKTWRPKIATYLSYLENSDIPTQLSKEDIEGKSTLSMGKNASFKI